MSDVAIEQPREFYEARTGLTGSEALGWDTPGSHQAHLSHAIELALAVGAKLEGARVHDAGCGHADLLPLLTAHKIGHYTGTDFMPTAIQYATDRVLRVADRPVCHFAHADILRDPVPEADVTFLIGTLAYHRPDAVETILERVWAATESALVFHSWWGLPRDFVAYKMVRETQRCIESFMRRRGKHHARLFEYGPQYEALFALSR